ncbi:MAG: hypothetical protein HWQ36_20710 [Nostoc sp. NMS2]|uniref:hypothetical protein n=1 Tax=Nostoc sp. NMS2 TaxID=2815389 RepID=UPI0025D33397|nr:hypothetical protein [Nostoc sp. NMS2]MBN3992866.1 hypothetical protein [Nostoc sp. NMS2]
MINSKPKSAVVQSLGSESAAFVRQLCAVASGNFRNILPSGLPTQKCWVRIGERLKGKGIKYLSPLPLYLYPAKETWLTTRATDLLLLISPALLLGIVLASGKSLGTDITLRLDTAFSKEFQGESQ